MRLVRYLNKRRILLGSCFNGETVGVYLKSGELRYHPFLGFCGVVDAKDNAIGVPVKLDIQGFYRSFEVGEKLVELKSGEVVQGCAVAFGVYAIIENGGPRIVAP